MLGRLFEAKRSTKRTISLGYDAIALGASFYLATCLRLGRFDVPIGATEIFSLSITIFASLVFFTRLGLYRAILRFMAHQAILSVAIGVFVSAAVLAASSFFLNSITPRSVPIIYAFAALFFVGTPRLLIRNVVLLLNGNSSTSREHIIIYGAGNSGFQLASALQGSRYKVMGFVDDNPKVRGTILRGLKVFNPKKLPTLIQTHNLKHILLAVGNAPRSQRSAIISKLEPLGISIKTIPAMGDILNGKSKIEDIKDVDVEDLLGRDPIKPNQSLLSASINGKNILVTGAGGSIGSELCRQIIKLSPLRLVLYELNEFNLYQLEQELSSELQISPFKIELVSLIGSVQNKDQLEDSFKTFNIHTVYHAAAYKHVPLIEHNVVEGVKNNVFGTWACAEAAINSNVESFVLVSTDKAVRPTNIMGATKRVAELVLQALSHRQKSTRFTMVRFGNVLGSSGSVVPLFRNQIRTGGPITVTHKDIIRYFMTIPEAAELVIQAGSMGTGGDVFVLDMGKPVKIIDLAKRMVHLSGLTLKDEGNLQGDIEIEVTGLRPGEKLYEELLVGENASGTIHPRIMRAEEKYLEWKETEELLKQLNAAALEYDCDELKRLLHTAPADYQPSSDIKDWVWSQKQKSSKLRLISN